MDPTRSQYYYNPHFFQYSGAIPTLASGLPTSVPLLTPTTLASLEQTFTELQSIPTTSACSSSSNLNPLNEIPSFNRNTESGFVPPVINMVKQEFDYGSDPEWTPPGFKRARVTTAAAIPQGVIRPTYATSVITSQSAAPVTPRRHTGPRAPRNDFNVSNRSQLSKQPRIVSSDHNVVLLRIFQKVLMQKHILANTDPLFALLPNPILMTHDYINRTKWWLSHLTWHSFLVILSSLTRWDGSGIFFYSLEHTPSHPCQCYVIWICIGGIDPTDVISLDGLQDVNTPTSQFLEGWGHR